MLLQLMTGWFESVWLYIFCCHSFSCNTMHYQCIWISISLWYFLYDWFQVALVFSFAECDMFIGLIWHENIHRCFSLYAVYIIYNVDVGILPFCWMLIADKTCHMPLNCVSFDVDWDDVIMSRRYLKSCLNNSYSCLLFTVSSISEKSAILLYVTVLFLMPGILQGNFFSGYQFQIVFLCLVICHI